MELNCKVFGEKALKKLRYDGTIINIHGSVCTVVKSDGRLENVPMDKIKVELKK